MNSSPDAERGRRVAVGAARRDFAPWRDPAAAPLIRFEGLTKRFGPVVAVDELSLDIYEREFFCLLGPSGCGKSTLMRLLAGFETPDAGRILLAGADIAGVPPYRRTVNMMFQSYALFPHMTVSGNIAFGLRQEGMDRDEIDGRVAEMLRLVQLDGLGARRPDQLSGGQRQRVALARALAKRPKVLLLDEPLAALDKKLRQETQFELMDIQVRLGTTFLVVTHDQEEAMTMSNRIGVMDRGRLVQVAPPGEVYEAPATRYVAGFVGDINMFEGTVADREPRGWRIQCPSLRTPLVVASDAALAPGQSVAVAVRPEKVTLHRSPPTAGTPNGLEGEVWDIGYLGDTTRYVIRLAGGGSLRVAVANATRMIEPTATWEDRVHVSFAPTAGIVLTR
jgi:putrescine transport system ATP-binding protein